MTLAEIWDAIARRWWLVIGVPLVVLVAVLVTNQFRPWDATVRATVLIPGDTEVPGSAERPELMVLDDLPPFIESMAFAEGVHAAMPGTTLTVDEVHAALWGERYSRVLTVHAVTDDPADASEIAAGVEVALPGLVNEYLVPANGVEATVKVIDPPSEPTRSRTDDALRIAILMLLGLIAGVVLAVMAEWAATQRAVETTPPPTVEPAGLSRG